MALDAIPSPGFSQIQLDAKVDAMISFADLDNDGQVDFQEYQKIIQAGCDTRGAQQVSNEKSDLPPPLGTPVDVWEDGRTIYL